VGTADLRNLPSVERLVSRLEQEDGMDRFPRPLLTECARVVLEDARARLLKAEPVDLSLQTLMNELRSIIASRATPTLTRAVNATGIILHTNLGRAPLCDAAAQAVADVLSGYSTLEIDRQTGRRGMRHQHVEPLLARVTGAEAGFAVTNNAAAVLLTLAALARGKEVIVSRGELVEIGGSFRMPDVMTQSGAHLVEVGTTNRTHVRDYERAITPDTALLVKVHHSNFKMTGFVTDVSAGDLVELGHRHGIRVLLDLGSGCLVDLRTRGLPHEPTVQEAIAAGCDLVTFSGDKLLGGPQAGLIVGGLRSVEAVRSHPLARAARMDKLGLAALAATLRQYIDPNVAWQTLPVLRMLGVSANDLDVRAQKLAQAIAAVVPAAWRAVVRPSVAEVGGGSLPEAHLPSFAVAITSPLAADDLEKHLRGHTPPIFARIEGNEVLLDVRTFLSGDESALIEAFRAIQN
jgi:L-seryl-tRNA(Ser) seleniumtransferase